MLNVLNPMRQEACWQENSKHQEGGKTITELRQKEKFNQVEILGGVSNK